MGGKSSRMKRDKALLNYNGNLLHNLAAAKLKPYCKRVLFSINEDQQVYSLQNTVLDEHSNQGPLSGIVSSLFFTKSPILALAVDVPKISTKTIEKLILERDKSRLVTAYYNSNKQKWEGLLSIWEAECLKPLSNFFDDRGRSVQEFLNSINAKQVEVDNQNEFTNVNTAKEYNQL